MNADRKVRRWVIAAAAGIGLTVLCVTVAGQLGAQTETAPKYRVDPTWPKPLPNKWKMGGVTGLAVDKDDNVWVYDRPNDLTDIELEAELTPPIADCCVRPPSMIHIDKEGNVIGSFDPPQGHGMAVDSKGFVYIGNTVNGSETSASTIRRPANMLARIASRAGDAAGRGGGDAAPKEPHVPGHGSVGPVLGFLPARQAVRIRRSAAARSGGSRGFPREVSSDDADDRGRNRRSSPRRTGARTLRLGQLSGRARDGV